MMEVAFTAVLSDESSLNLVVVVRLALRVKTAGPFSLSSMRPKINTSGLETRLMAVRESPQGPVAEHKRWRTPG